MSKDSVLTFPLDGFCTIPLQTHSNPTNITLWLLWFQWHLYFLTVHWLSFVTFTLSPDSAVNTLNTLISRFFNNQGGWHPWGLRYHMCQYEDLTPLGVSYQPIQKKAMLQNLIKTYLWYSTNRAFGCCKRHRCYFYDGYINVVQQSADKTVTHSKVECSSRGQQYQTSSWLWW